MAELGFESWDRLDASQRARLLRGERIDVGAGSDVLIGGPSDRFIADVVASRPARAAAEARRVANLQARRRRRAEEDAMARAAKARRDRGRRANQRAAAILIALQAALSVVALIVGMRVSAGDSASELGGVLVALGTLGCVGIPLSIGIAYFAVFLTDTD